MPQGRVLALMALVTLPGVTACSYLGDDNSIEICQQRAAAGYPAIEAIAEKALEGVAYSLRRTDQCEETLRPWTMVVADVPGWHNRHKANRYFRGVGWRDVNGQLTSPDGSYWIDNVTTGDKMVSPHAFVAAEFQAVPYESCPCPQVRDWTWSGYEYARVVPQAERK